MPWSKTNVPSAAKKPKGKKLEIFVAAANAALKEYGDEGKAIATGLAAAKRHKGKMKKDLNKALTDEVKAKLQIRLKERYKDSNLWVMDYDDEENVVYYEIWDQDTGSKTYRVSFLMQENIIVLGSDVTEVYRTYEYEEVSKNKFSFDSTIPLYSEMERSLLDKFTDMLSKHFGGSQENKKVIIKQLDDEEMVAIEQLYITIGDIDGVGDTYASPEVCREMVRSFNQAIEKGNLKANYFHKVMTEDFTVLKAWVCEVDCIIGETEVKEGTPLVKVKFNNEKAWNLRKSGDLMGVSIGAIAEWEVVDE